MLYLGRFQFIPNWRAAADLPGAVRDTTRLPRFQASRTADDWLRVRRLTAGALDAIADYEEWVATSLGLDHRRESVASWFKTRFAAERVAPSWRALARRIGYQAA